MYKHIALKNKRIAKSVGFALTLNNFDAWQALGLIAKKIS